jgi:dTDP-glucose pyrophosphorylase
MTSRVGIILAAGSAQRWGGVVKELMPTGDQEWIIDSSIQALVNVGVDRIILVSSPEKISTHARHFTKKRYGSVRFMYVVAPPGEMWDSLLSALPFTGDVNFLTMADTIIPPDAFSTADVTKDFSLGTFRTQEPRRFSVVYNGRIFTKPEDADGEYAAWGTVVFSQNAAEFWQTNEFEHYDRAFNMAIGRYGLHTYQMAYCHDIANFFRLLDYIHWRKEHGADQE